MSSDPLETALENLSAATRTARQAQLHAEQEASEWEEKYRKEREKVLELRIQLKELDVSYDTSHGSPGPMSKPPGPRLPTRRRNTVPLVGSPPRSGSQVASRTVLYSEGLEPGTIDLAALSNTLATWVLLQGAASKSGGRPLWSTRQCDEDLHRHHGIVEQQQEKDHTTISVADDGHSGVGAAAAAATAVALAQSWAGVAGRGFNDSVHEAQACVNPGKARFKLVAAVPRNLGNPHSSPSRAPSAIDHQPLGVSPSRASLMTAASGSSAYLNGNGNNGSTDPTSGTGIALETLDSDPRGLDDSQEAEWRASGSHLKLHWLSAPKSVLVIYKPGVADVLEATAKAIAWLLRRGIAVYIEPEAFKHGQVNAAVRASLIELERSASRSSSRGSTVFGRADSLSPTCQEYAEEEEAAREAIVNAAATVDTILGQLLLTWPAHSLETCDFLIPHSISSSLDMVLTLGGDGTVLWSCSLFGNNPVPPVVPLAMGSLGFMTPFPLSRMDSVLSRVTSVAHGFPLMLRHRLQCRIIRAGETSTLDLMSLSNTHYVRQGLVCGDEVVVLNEVVIDRGPCANLANLQCFVDQNFVTTIQGDGLIVATPTGSTAYNLAAGGSMVHPSVPCILFTPICAHTLSSRPLVFPEHVILKVKVPADSRSEAYCSFDGRGRTALRPGDSVVIHVSQWPVPMVCNNDSTHDWFLSVREGLNWNRRVPQKPHYG